MEIDLKDLDKKWNKEHKEDLKDLKLCKSGKLKAVVFYNQYKDCCFMLPTQFKRRFEFYIKRGDIKGFKIEKEEFKKIIKLQNKIIKTEKQKRELIKDLIKQKEVLKNEIV